MCLKVGLMHLNQTYDVSYSQTAAGAVTASICDKFSLVSLPPFLLHALVRLYLLLLSPSALLVSFPLPLLPGRSCLFPFEDGFLDDGHGDPSLTPGLNSPTRCQNGERMERYSRKVFVGGLPPDIDEGK